MFLSETAKDVFEYKSVKEASCNDFLSCHSVDINLKVFKKTSNVEFQLRIYFMYLT